MDSHLDGLVVKEQSGFFWVEASDGTTYRCRLRGRLMEQAQSADIAAIGDRVRISIVDNDETGDIGWVETVAERDSVLSRSARTVGNRGGGDAEREHVIVANADAIFFVIAAADPAPNTHLLDRMLVAGELSDVEDLVIVVNKVDLEDPTNIENRFQPYEKMGYTVLYTSAKDGRGIASLRDWVNGRITAFTGPSGVGKTSLLNCIQPGLGRQVKQVSANNGEGVHTTRDSALIKLSADTYLADTPGMRNLNVYDVEPAELDGYFRDVAAHAPSCRFSDCSHINNEPQCAVMKAVRANEISKRRYKSYRRLRQELEAARTAQYS